MITAVDTSVLTDVLTDRPGWSEPSLVALQQSRTLGVLIICPVVWAEIRALFRSEQIMKEALDNAGILFDPFDEPVAERAGEIWRVYREQGGKRTRLIADFLVGAHAERRAGRLLTRDRGFYRRYFSRLRVIEPRAERE